MCVCGIGVCVWRGVGVSVCVWDWCVCVWGWCECGGGGVLVMD